MPLNRRYDNVWDSTQDGFIYEFNFDDHQVLDQQIDANSQGLTTLLRKFPGSLSAFQSESPARRVGFTLGNWSHNSGQNPRAKKVKKFLASLTICRNLKHAN